MHESILQRLAERRGPAGADGALERAKAGLEALAETAAGLEATLPARLADALHAEALPVARGLAEVRGLAAQTIRRLERLETELAAERGARLDDLAVLVELIASGWQGVERRLERIEAALQPPLAKAS